MTDFARLKEQVSIRQVLELLSIRQLTEKDDTLRGKCPLCDSTNPRGFVVNPTKGTFYCFSERAGGDMIRLAARRLQTDDKGGAEHIAKHLLNGAGKAADNGPAPPRAEDPSRKSPGFDPLKYLEKLDAEHEALKGLDILPETLIAWKAGYASQGLNRGRLAVAWHDASGKLGFFIGVALDSTIPHYLVPKDCKMPYFFGTDRIEEGEPLRIVPDILDVLRAYENGMENVICPLAPTDADALTSLRALVMEKKLTVEF